MALLDKKLSEIKLSREIIEVYRDVVTDESLIGVVAGFNDDFVYMSLLTEEGEDKGISVFYRHNITRIYSNGTASSAIGRLKKIRNTEFNFPTIDLSSIDTIISSIQKAYGCISLHTEYMKDYICYVGELDEYDDEWVLVRGYGTVSNRDPNSLLLKKEEITKVDAGSTYEESLRMLAREADM